MADPLVDVRIATWLVMPDACEVTDSPTRVSLRKGDNPWNLEGLLNLRAGKEAVTSSVAVLRKVSGTVTKTYADTRAVTRQSSMKLLVSLNSQRKNGCQ